MVFVELKTVVIKTLIEIRGECMNKVRMSTEIENIRKYQTETTEPEPKNTIITLKNSRRV